MEDDPAPFASRLAASASVTERSGDSVVKMQGNLPDEQAPRSGDPLRVEVIVAGLPGSADSPALYMADMRGTGGRDLGEWFPALRFSALRRVALGIAAEFPGAVRSPFPPRYLLRDVTTNAQNISERAEALGRFCTALVDAVKAGRTPIGVLERFAPIPAPTRRVLQDFISEREAVEAAAARRRAEVEAQARAEAEIRRQNAVRAQAEADAAAAAAAAQVAAMQARRQEALRAARSDVQPINPDKAVLLLDQGVLL